MGPPFLNRGNVFDEPPVIEHQPELGRHARIHLLLPRCSSEFDLYDGSIWCTQQIRQNGYQKCGTSGNNYSYNY